MKVAIFNTKSYDREFFEKHNGSHGHELTYYEAPLHEGTCNLAQHHHAVCIFVNSHVTAETVGLLASYGVKIIALRCAGFNNVDLSACAEHHIKVVRVPAYSPEAVAEHAVALIMALNRKTHKAYNRVREGNFSLERLMGFDMKGKTVGVVGTGNIGQAFAWIMRGFRCKVLAFDPNENEELRALGVTYVSFDEVLKESDIISLHCPLIPQTEHLLDDAAFVKMKRGVMVINTSRGKLIDTRAAITALKSGHLGYLGLDVYEQEENLFFNDLSERILQDDLITRLMTFPNVLVTAHQGFFTQEALDEITTTTLQSLTDFEKGSTLDYQVKAN